MVQKVAIIFSAAASIAALSATTSGAQELDASQIEALISGKTVHLSTPYGADLPLRYDPNGQVTGDIRGFSFVSLFAPRETGRWWTEGNQMCQQWPTWYDGETLCFTVQQTGEATINWTRQDGMEGTARIEG